MITWQQLANFLPLAGLLVAVGIYQERIAALRRKVDDLDKRQAESAKDQGRRIGNLESFTGLTADGVPVDQMREMSGRVRGSDGR